MIDKDGYKLNEENYHKEETFKTQILLTDSQSSEMNHYEQWLNKNPIGFKKTTHYTIRKDGSIFEHFSPEYYGTIFGIEEIDKKIISISLENEGWLEYSRKKNGFINWRGDIYEDKDSVTISQWRGQLFWVPYTEPQVESLIKLLEKLCCTYKIKRNIVDSNVYFDMSENILGIVSKSNYSRFSTDVNPTLDLELIKENIQL
jgi:N-acetyl-anhydromuramyl-L-alanine amidase AmpD